MVDERLYRINDLGQTELLYDPGEEVVQGKDKSDLPTGGKLLLLRLKVKFLNNQH